MAVDESRRGVLAHERGGGEPGYELCGASSAAACRVAKPDGHMVFESKLALAQFNVMAESDGWRCLPLMGDAEDLRQGRAVYLKDFRVAAELAFWQRFTPQGVGSWTGRFEADTVETVLRDFALEVRKRILRSMERALLDPGWEEMPHEIRLETLMDVLSSEGSCPKEELDRMSRDASGWREDDLEYAALLLRDWSMRQAGDAARALAAHFGLDLTKAEGATLTVKDDELYRRQVVDRARSIAKRCAEAAADDADAYSVVEFVAGAWDAVTYAWEDRDKKRLRDAVQLYAKALERFRSLDDIPAAAIGNAEVMRRYRSLMGAGKYEEAAMALTEWEVDTRRLILDWIETHPSSPLYRMAADVRAEYDGKASQTGFPAKLDRALDGRFGRAYMRISSLPGNMPTMRLAQGNYGPMDVRRALSGYQYRRLMMTLGETPGTQELRGRQNYELYGRFALTRDGDGTITTDPDGRSCCARWLAAQIDDPSRTCRELGDDDDEEGAELTSWNDMITIPEARLAYIPCADPHEAAALETLIQPADH